MRTYLVYGVIAILVFGVSFSFFLARTCTTPTPQDPVMSSHGWGVWFDSNLMSFPHDGRRVCVPSGWEPVGALSYRWGGAIFPPEASAVLIRSEAFFESSFNPVNTRYMVRVVYPRDTAQADVEAYLNTINSAFSSIGPLFESSDGAELAHTALITVGIAGAGDDFETSVYPLPGPETTILARHPTHKRSEELYVHAIAHLYNRFRTDLLDYQSTQTPLPAEDWQEMEASWIEVVYRTSDEARERRVGELYAIHRAVERGEYSDALIYPFGERDHFDALEIQSVVIPAGSGYSDYQYGHYILAPLVMIAIDGLLESRGQSLDVATLLTDIHAGTRTNIFDEVAPLLEENDRSALALWMEGEELIPEEYIERGLGRYKAKE